MGFDRDGRLVSGMWWDVIMIFFGGGEYQEAGGDTPRTIYLPNSEDRPIPRA
jgi:hypothetical protein